MKFTESQLEQAFIHLLQQEEMQHVLGNDLRKTEGNMVEESRETYGHIATDKVLIEEDLRTFLTMQYREEGIPVQKLMVLLGNWSNCQPRICTKAIRFL